MAGALAGAAHLRRGLAAWRTRPRLMLLGVVPALVVLALVAAGLVALLLRADDLTGALTPFADGWAEPLRVALRVGLAVALLLGAGLLAAVTFTAVVLAVGDPVYAHIWRRTELDLGGLPDGRVPDGGLGWWRSLRDSGALLLVGLCSALGVAALGLLPVVGAVAGVVLGVLVGGRLLGAELLARPLEARGMDRHARRRLLARHRAEVLGFGVATQLCFLVPLGAVLVMPAAVVGATGLARDLLADQPAVPPRSA